MAQPHGSRSERSFGLSVGPVCGLLGAFTWWRGHQAAGIGLVTVAVLLIIPALTWPSLLKGPNAVWWQVAGALGWMNTRLILSALFLVVFTPASAVARVMGWDPLRRHRRAGRDGWGAYPERIRDPAHYKRMY
jgi:hypothetical protein